MNLRIALLRPDAKPPTRATPGSVGFDLYAPADAWAQARSVAHIDTGVAIELPAGFEAQVRGRSGLSRRGIFVPTGTIDSDYRGPIGVLVHNSTRRDFQIRAGDRIAQLVIAPVVTPDLEVVAELGATVRGDGGFGSSGA